MTQWDSSRTITLDLGPTFNFDVDRGRTGQVSWLDDVSEDTSLIFKFEMPLELVDISTSKAATTSGLSGSSPVSIEFIQCGREKTHGIEPDPYIRNILRAGGRMGLGVDSLSRSVVLSDINEHTVIDALQANPNIDAGWLIESLRRNLLIPSFYGELDDEATSQAIELVRSNVRRHEREHMRCLLNPSTALWRELGLYYRLILLSSQLSTWHSPSFLNTTAALYMTPSRFTVELLALLKEDYTSADPTVQQAVQQRVVAQRGAEGDLLRFIDRQNVDTDALTAMLQSPTGGRYCDLWLGYIIDRLRSGYSLSEIDKTEFFSRIRPLNGGGVPDPEMRDTTVDYMSERCLGPVIELVRLKSDAGFVLERSWFSIGTDISEAEGLLAVRRALFRRIFSSNFVIESGLDNRLDDRETAIKRIIHGTPFSEAQLFDMDIPSTDQLAGSLSAARTNAITTLLGPTASVEELHMWLDHPEYEDIP
ncbi:hypothetical protein ACFQJ8_27305 [Halocatena marina]|uniref:hypothetical protein n=1 Tax=Halocatena marina TaxID=2934937 RepID=UPI003617B818